MCKSRARRLVHDGRLLHAALDRKGNLDRRRKHVRRGEAAARCTDGAECAGHEDGTLEEIELTQLLVRDLSLQNDKAVDAVENVHALAVVAVARVETKREHERRVPAAKQVADLDKAVGVDLSAGAIEGVAPGEQLMENFGPSGWSIVTMEALVGPQREKVKGHVGGSIKALLGQTEQRASLEFAQAVIFHTLAKVVKFGLDFVADEQGADTEGHADGIKGIDEADEELAGGTARRLPVDHALGHGDKALVGHDGWKVADKTR